MTNATDASGNVARMHRLLAESISRGANGVRDKQKRIYDLLRMIVRDEFVGLTYTTETPRWEVESVVNTILLFCSTYPDAAEHLIHIVDTEWEGVHVFPRLCFELLEHSLALGDNWNDRFRLAFLYYKYGMGGDDGRRRQRFEQTVSFARRALAQGDKREVIADDLKTLAWMAAESEFDDLAAELQQLFDTCFEK
jgi:hypothetical protein